MIWYDMNCMRCLLWELMKSPKHSTSIGSVSTTNDVIKTVKLTCKTKTETETDQARPRPRPRPHWKVPGGTSQNKIIMYIIIIQWRFLTSVRRRKRTVKGSKRTSWKSAIFTVSCGNNDNELVNSFFTGYFVKNISALSSPDFSSYN